VTQTIKRFFDLKSFVTNAVMWFGMLVALTIWGIPDRAAKSAVDATQADSKLNQVSTQVNKVEGELKQLPRPQDIVTQTEFKVMNTKLEAVQAGVDEIKQDVKYLLRRGR
jgi:tetrahydromethanopterin S-methyltransferase subunit G